MSSTSYSTGHSKQAFIVTTITWVFATVFVAARIVSRFVILRHRTADDWCMILAWFLAFGLSFVVAYGTSKGLGRHDSIPASQIGYVRRCEYAFTIFYYPALMATKTSILILYLRLSKNSQRMLRIASYTTLGVVNVGGVVLTFLSAFQCTPVRAAYQTVDAPSRCISIIELYLCSSPVNIITDLAILALPIPVLTGMRLPQRQKTILVVTFALGIFVTIVDVLRIYYLQASLSDPDKGSRLGASPDSAWNSSTALVWSAVEVNVAIICGCVPTLKPLVRRILPAMITNPSRSGDSKTGSLSSQHNNEPRRPSSTCEPELGITPLPRAQSAADQEAGVDMMDFFTVPETFPGTVRTQASHGQTRDNAVYFGFFNVQVPKSMLKTKGMESFKYCAIVTILFFLWGFSYGILNTLNNEISRIANQSAGQTLSLSAAYFGAYLLGPTTLGQWVLRHNGFRATFICGLCIYGTGTLMFWPSAVLTSFPGFLISNFVVGFGLSVLETAANPFMALCGPTQTAEFRLLLAQGVQAVATVLSELLVERVLFSSIYSKPSLIDVQWTYLAITLLTVILALFFYYMPLPEASDSDLQIQADDLGIYSTHTVFSGVRLRLIYTTLGLAVFSQFCYVAAQESMAVWFSKVLTDLSTKSRLALTPDNYLVIGHTTFAIGRFAFALLCLYIPPRILLLFTFVGGLVLSIITMALHTNGNGIAAPGLIFFFFEGPVWPLVFAIGLRGLGRRTKLGAALLAAGASGGATFPLVMYAVQRLDHKSVQYSYCVIIALFTFGMLFPLYLTLVPRARAQVDPKRDSLRTRNRKRSRPFSLLSKDLGWPRRCPKLPTVKGGG